MSGIEFWLTTVSEPLLVDYNLKSIALRPLHLPLCSHNYFM